MTVYIIAIIVIFLLLLFMLNFEYYRHKLGVSTSHSAQVMREAKLAEIHEQFGKDAAVIIIDPGCGSGGLVRFIAANCPNAKVIGLELSPVPFAQAFIVQKLFGPKNAMFRKENFFEYDYRTADVVMTFLPEPVLHKLAPVLDGQMKQGSILLSNAFEMPIGWRAYKKELIQPILKRYLYCYKK